MIRSCLLKRQELVEMIKKAPQTKDGYYFFPRFRALVLNPGFEKDSGFYFDRGLFQDKICFEEEDIKMFLSKKRIAVDYEFKRMVDMKIKDVLQGIEYLNLKDKIPGQEYTLQELIDTTMYWLKYRYS